MIIFLSDNLLQHAMSGLPKNGVWLPGYQPIQNSGEYYIEAILQVRSSEIDHGPERKEVDIETHT